MTNHDYGSDRASDRDVIDAIREAPFVGRATTRLERSIAPSCLLSLVIVLLLMLLLRRFMFVSWPMLVCIVGVVWYLVLLLLVRWRPERVIDKDELRK